MNIWNVSWLCTLRHMLLKKYPFIASGSFSTRGCSLGGTWEKIKQTKVHNIGHYVVCCPPQPQPLDSFIYCTSTLFIKWCHMVQHVVFEVLWRCACSFFHENHWWCSLRGPNSLPPTVQSGPPNNRCQTHCTFGFYRGVLVHFVQQNAPLQVRYEV